MGKIFVSNAAMKNERAKISRRTFAAVKNDVACYIYGPRDQETGIAKRYTLYVPDYIFRGRDHNVIEILGRKFKISHGFGRHVLTPCEGETVPPAWFVDLNDDAACYRDDDEGYHQPDADELF